MIRALLLLGFIVYMPIPAHSQHEIGCYPDLKEDIDRKRKVIRSKGRHHVRRISSK